MEGYLPESARKVYADALEETIRALQALIRAGTRVEDIYHDKDYKQTTLMSLGEMLNDLCNYRDDLEEDK